MIEPWAKWEGEGTAMKQCEMLGMAQYHQVWLIQDTYGNPEKLVYCIAPTSGPSKQFRRWATSPQPMKVDEFKPADAEAMVSGLRSAMQFAVAECMADIAENVL